MQGSAYTPPPFSLTGWADPAYTPLPSTSVTVVTDVTVVPELVGWWLQVARHQHSTCRSVRFRPFSVLWRAREACTVDEQTPLDKNSSNDSNCCNVRVTVVAVRGSAYTPLPSRVAASGGPAYTPPPFSRHGNHTLPPPCPRSRQERRRKKGPNRRSLHQHWSAVRDLVLHTRRPVILQRRRCRPRPRGMQHPVPIRKAPAASRKGPR